MKRILVTGGAGFISSHLIESLLEKGNEIWAIDNFITGNESNIEHLKSNDKFHFTKANASLPPSEYLDKELKFDHVYHMASPASPRGYQDNPVETYLVNSFGTHYLAEYAQSMGARFMFASTSEVYGDPLEHPQKEAYWGNVHIRGVRSCYDVSKRFGEMVQTVWQRDRGLDIRTIRIFNTYGPRMDPRDGRVFPNFISQAVKGEPITVYGDGSQTRSFCYVSDLVDVIIKIMESEKTAGEAYNIGNPEEHTILEMAELIKELTGTKSEIVHEELPQDDPTRRKPDISKVKKALDWEPKVELKDGLEKTIEYFRGILK